MGRIIKQEIQEYEPGAWRQCFYESKFVKGFHTGNPSRSSLCRSLLEFFPGQLAKCPGRDMFQGCFGLWLLRFGWQLGEVSRQRPWTSFYPCRSRTGHPMRYAHQAQEAFRERPHLYFGSHEGRPAPLTGRSHQLSEQRHRDPDSL